ncbi:MAG: translation initiation factor IF-2 [Cyanobacteriota bacterium]|nr:translation initiation factor IF-2 [Cyanobacteriota bacterium]
MTPSETTSLAHEHPPSWQDPSPPTDPPSGSGAASLSETSEVAVSEKDPDKVRIYDLAREMGRDNRDVMDVCTRLEIPYKSHSSTITREQAQQVRGDLTHSNPSPPAPSKPRATPPRPQPKPSRNDRPQHILEVRRPVGEKISTPRPPLAEVSPPSAAETAFPPEVPQRPSRSAAAEAASATLVRPPQRPPEKNTTPQRPPLPEASESLSPPSTDAMALPESAEKTVAEKTVKETPPLAPQRPVAPQRLVESPKVEPPLSLSDPNLTPLSEPTPPPPEPQSPQRPAVLAPPPRSSEPPVRPAATAPSRRPASPEGRPSPRPQPEVPPGKQERDSVAPPARPSLSSPRPRSSEPVKALRPAEAAPPVPSKPTSPRPQLVGAPVRPGTRAAETRALQGKEGIPTPDGEGTKSPDKALRPTPRLKTDLVAPPSRPTANPDGSLTPPVRPNPVLADAPVRPVARLRRKEVEETEDEELLALKRGVGRGAQAKRKRSRRKGEGEGETLEIDTTLSVVAKQAELNTLKPLPRPSAKPPSQHVATSPPLARVRPPSVGLAGRGRRSHQATQETARTEQEPQQKILSLHGELTVQELANRMRIAPTEIIKILFLKGLMVNLNQLLDRPTIEVVAKELEYTIEIEQVESTAKKTEMLDLDDIEHLVSRSPVVTIMGHVDHGKTTLLDAIRDTKVVEGEAGGITQRIGAYHVDVQHEGESKRVVFLDTPGHEAFTAMRARGAKVTDIAVLVVAADDGVQPQTLEAISHAQAAQVPIIVAVNKIDKPDSQPDRIKQQLAEHSLVPEEWGGDTPMVEVSALARLNLDSLLEMILLVAEIGELQANPDRPARGTVVEANLDKSRGPIATLLVQNGTLRVGDTLVAGSVLGRVKAMVDDRGHRLQEAGPSSAVQLLGLNGVPAAGDEFLVYRDEREARQVAETRAEEQHQARLQQTSLSRRASLGSVSAQAQEGQLKELNLILKTDVQGSAEAILASLQDLPQQEVQLRVLLSAPGEITETDVDLAVASNAIILGFTTSTAASARLLADRYGVDIREYDVIYNLLDDLRAAMEGLLEPEQVEEPLGQAEVRQVITIGKGAIAGSYVQSGKIVRNAHLRVRRRGELVFEGRLDSLKRFKDDVREVAAGFECGIGVEKFQAWVIGDIVEAYQMVSKRRSLTPEPTARR